MEIWRMRRMLNPGLDRRGGMDGPSATCRMMTSCSEMGGYVATCAPKSVAERSASLTAR